MAEQHLPQHEKYPEHEARHERQEHAPKHLEPNPEHSVDKDELVAELSRQATEEASPSRHVRIAEQGDKQPSALFVNRELKHLTFQRTITRIQKRLPAPARLFSKAVHQPILDTISNMTEKTLARPSGILAGSVVAFLGSSAYLWAAKYYGFRYNYLLFMFLFLGGFVVGVLIELALYIRSRSR